MATEPSAARITIVAPTTASTITAIQVTARRQWPALQWAIQRLGLSAQRQCLRLRAQQLQQLLRQQLLQRIVQLLLDGYYGGGACPAGWDCCGFGLCCGNNQHCCGNGRCCPDGWSCNNNGTCDPYNYNAASATAAQAIPSTPAIAITEDQYYKIPAQ